MSKGKKKKNLSKRRKKRLNKKQKNATSYEDIKKQIMK